MRLYMHILYSLYMYELEAYTVGRRYNIIKIYIILYGLYIINVLVYVYIRSAFYNITLCVRAAL